jgi:hypothetical protein
LKVCQDRLWYFGFGWFERLTQHLPPRLPCFLMMQGL